MKNMKKGFTLVELLVVIAIIGLLATLALVSVGGVRVRARDARRVADIAQMRNALELHSTQVGTYPVNAATIAVGVAGTNILCSVGGFTGACAAPATSFMSAVPRDTGRTGATAACGGVAPCDYAYKSDAAGTNYGLQFATEQDPDGNGSLAAGANCASPAGLVAGVCP